MKASFDVFGMNCAACSSAVEKSVLALGCESATVNLLAGTLKAEFDENRITKDDIKKAVENAGFKIDDAKSPAQKRLLLRKKAEKDKKIMLARLIVSSILMVILMYIAMGNMLGLYVPSFITGNNLIYALIQLCISLLTMLINSSYFTSGFKKLFLRKPNMDSLIAVGSSAAFIYGVYAVFKIYSGNTHFVHQLYFETAAMIPAIVTIGKYLETRSKSSTSKALDLLIDLTPKTALIFNDGIEKQIDVDNLKEDDTIIIKPGMSVPCDGVVISGESYIDESSLTGESVPVYKSQSSNVNAGTINTTGTIIVKVKHTGDDTLISEIIKLVESASGSKPEISRLADKISAVFVPIVILISIITFAVWMITTGNFEFAFSCAICVLVISCPCSLGLATPLAITISTGLCASHGILIKDAKILELAGKTDVVFFDKTGTLTQGKPLVTDIIPTADFEENEFLKVCASIESMSEHPLGAAVVSKAKERNLPLYKVEKFNAITGKGLYAVIDGKEYYAGNYDLIESLGIAIDDKTKDLYANLCAQSKTPLLFVFEKVFAGIISVCDNVREDSKKTVSTLAESGIESIMLTGDNKATATSIAEQLGIKTFYSEISPIDKERYVTSYRNSQKVVMMFGDGINDAPALTSANIGISVSSGTDIALESSDIVLLNNDTYSVAKTVKISRKTLSNIKLSLFWALLYNTLGIPVAAGVLYPAFGITLNPMIGAAAMSLSSLCVVTNALRLRKFKFD